MFPKKDDNVTSIRPAESDVETGLTPADESQMTSDRKADILREALAIVEERGKAYGTPTQNFTCIARRWNAHLANRGMNVKLNASDVAIMMLDMKLSRLEGDPLHMDSWVDVCGYGACGGSIAKDKITTSWIAK